MDIKLKSNMEPDLGKMAAARKAYTANAELQGTLSDLIEFFSQAKLDSKGGKAEPKGTSLEILRTYY